MKLFASKKSDATGAGTPVASVGKNLSRLISGTTPTTTGGEVNPAPQHYTAQFVAGGWQFTTPTGRVPGFMSRTDCQRTADLSLRQDREEAASSISPIAAVLRKYFQLEGAKA